MKIHGYIGQGLGGTVYECVYTHKRGYEHNFKFMPYILPQASGQEAVYNSPEALARRKQSQADFNEMDANCNTCGSFIRQKSDNAKGSHPASNFVYGDCTNKDARLDLLPNKSKEYKVMVHVADYIGQPCWKARQ